MSETANVTLIDFTKREVRRITHAEVAQRMAAQRARGVVTTCEGIGQPPPRKTVRWRWPWLRPGTSYDPKRRKR